MSKRVRVHRNLHKARSGGPQWVVTKNGRVVEYLQEVTLKNVSTRIQPGGLKRCRRQQVRNVCGFLDGELAEVRKAGHRWSSIGFDPRVDSSFMAGGEQWNKADAVILGKKGQAWVLNPTWNGEERPP